jgi:hypothetical protein
VASSDVCKDDEWSYLCNTDAWAGAADAVTGGQELATAALRRALDHTIKHTACAAGDTTCASTKAIVDAQLLDIPKVRRVWLVCVCVVVVGVRAPMKSWLFGGACVTSAPTLNRNIEAPRSV